MVALTAWLGLAAACNQPPASTPSATTSPSATHSQFQHSVPNFDGVYDRTRDVSDSTGAIGKQRYLELVNARYGIFDRTGNKLAEGDLTNLEPGGITFDPSSPIDPQVLWDSNTDRFYYTFLAKDNAGSNAIVVGFSKDASPNTATDFCAFVRTNFGPNFPDFQKLGDMSGFLLIGYNLYASPVTNDTYLYSGVDWIAKPQGTGPISDCQGYGNPQSPSYLHAGRLRNGTGPALMNRDGSKAWTPVPVHEIDAGAPGWIVATPNTFTGASGKYISVFKADQDGHGGLTLNTNATSAIAVRDFARPDDAPQQPHQPQNPQPPLLDTLDGALHNAIGSIDPAHNNAMAIWTQHSVKGGAGAELRWYELDPTAATTLTGPSTAPDACRSGPAVVQCGVISDPSLYVFNGAISADRQANGTGGSNMALTYNTSSARTRIAIWTIQKAAGRAQSSSLEVPVAGPDGPQDRSCTTDNNKGHAACRWGDYSGANPDPLSPAIWFTNAYVDRHVVSTLCINECGLWRSINWAVATTSPAPSPAPTPSVISTPTPTAVASPLLPAAYVGTWSGTMNQTLPPPSSYSMTMTLQAAGIGAEIGEVSYPTLPCTTKLILRSVDPQAVTADEQVITGSCLNGTFTLQVSGRTITATWRGPTGEAGATASLTRSP